MDATPGSAAWCRRTAALRGGGAVFRPILWAMASAELARLASLAANVEETVAGVAELGEHLDATSASDAANALFEAERSLKMAGRSMARARRSLGD